MAGFILALYQVLGRYQPTALPQADIDVQAWYAGRYENSRVMTSKYWILSCEIVINPQAKLVHVCFTNIKLHYKPSSLGGCHVCNMETELQSTGRFHAVSSAAGRSCWLPSGSAACKNTEAVSSVSHSDSVPPENKMLRLQCHYR